MESETSNIDTVGSLGTCGPGPTTQSNDRAGFSEATTSNYDSNFQYAFSESDNPCELGRSKDMSAAAALVQLQGSNRTDFQAGDTTRFTGNNQTATSLPDMSNFYSRDPLSQSRSDPGLLAQSYPQERSGSNAFTTYSNSTSNHSSHMQGTVTNLSNTVCAMQQQQAHIAEALISLTTMVQQSMHRGSQSHTTNNSLSNAHNMQDVSHYENAPSATRESGGCNSYETQELSNRGDRQASDSNSRDFAQSGNFDEIQQHRWTDVPATFNTYRDRFYPRRQQVSQAYGSQSVEAKLPPFNGKEEWKVWINRFESVAKRRNWDNEAKLDNILPRLQGKAGDFVFNQLSQEVISCYPKLVKELNSRFHTIETEKTYAAKFSQRIQKHDETAEDYAAELKRLYSKAYKNRDCKTRQEDLVRRFLDGLKDQEARFEVEYHKEPEDIDKAVYHVVNFIQTRRRNYSGAYADRKSKKFARRASEASDIEDSEIEREEDFDDYEYAMRLPAKGEAYQKKKLQSKGEQKAELNPSQPMNPGNSMLELKDMVKALTDKVEELQKRNTVAPSHQRKASGAGNDSRIVCYACGIRGHISRNCPEKMQAQSASNGGYRQSANQGGTDRNSNRNGPLN